MSRLGVMMVVVTLMFLVYLTYKYVGCINASDSANLAAESLAAAIVKAYAAPVGTYGVYRLPSKIEGHVYSLEIVDTNKTGVLVKIRGTRCSVSRGGAPFNVNLTEFPLELKNVSEENITLFFKNSKDGLLIGRKSGCAGCIQVKKMYYNTTGEDCDNKMKEYVVLNNSCETSYELTGWTMKDEDNHSYVFPKYVLDPGLSVWIYTGYGTDSENILHWHNEGPCEAVWNAANIIYLMDVMNQTCLQQPIYHET